MSYAYEKDFPKAILRRSAEPSSGLGPGLEFLRRARCPSGRCEYSLKGYEESVWWIVYSDKLASTGKYSKATLDEYDKFQKGMLIRTGILLGVIVLYMITLATLPNVSGPSFLIPLGMAALSLLVYAVMWFAAYWKLNRLFTADRNRRRQRLLG